MTLELGPDEFTNALRRGRSDWVNRERRAALVALIEARSEFALQSDDAYESGARVAGQDSDRLEGIAQRLVSVVDAFQPAFDRLDIARERAGSGEDHAAAVIRSSWDRSAIAEALCEGLEPLLSAPAAAVLSAAVRLEASR